MEYNSAEEEKQLTLYNSIYAFGGLMLASVGYFMIKKPVGVSLSKEYFYSFLFSSLIVYGYSKWNHFKYVTVVNEIYDTLSERLNTFPHLKTLQSNNNMYSTEVNDEDID